MKVCHDLGNTGNSPITGLKDGSSELQSANEVCQIRTEQIRYQVSSFKVYWPNYT